MADCRQCADFDWCAEHEDCGLFKQKPITNADIIRAMSDEELAGWYCRARECTKCPHANGCRVVGEGILGWLKMEVMNDG